MITEKIRRYLDKHIPSGYLIMSPRNGEKMTFSIERKIDEKYLKVTVNVNGYELNKKGLVLVTGGKVV